MALHLRGGGGPEADHSSSPNSLSSPPSGLSNPASPIRNNPQPYRPIVDSNELILDMPSGPSFGVIPSQQAQYPPGVRLTAAGLPRKKPGRKPRTAEDGSASGGNTPKPRRQAKPKDPNAPVIPRKRKAPAGQENAAHGATPPPSKATPRQTKLTDTTTMMRTASVTQTPNSKPPAMPRPPSPTPTSRDGGPSSFLNILNPSPERPAVPSSRGSGLAFDPVRSTSYDPVRESMISRDPYGTSNLTSPSRIQLPNRTSASPSVANPANPVSSVVSQPTPAGIGSHASGIAPGNKANGASQAKQVLYELKSSKFSEPQQVKEVDAPVRKAALPAMPAPPAVSKAALNKSTAATISNGATEKSATAKKGTFGVSKEKRASSSSSSPKTSALKSSLPDLTSAPEPGNERSILDFGKIQNGGASDGPSIVINVSITPGENNKYVNFMRMAEDRYGWDALHPRLAQDRDRKARIAAAASALEKVDTSKEQEEDEQDDSDDSQSDGDNDNDNSNVEMGGTGNGNGNGNVTSGPEGPARKTKAKRRLKEDEYDKDDGFVDDSEMLWEAQAAASRDGFFVYSGPLQPEVEAPAARADGAPKRGRGSRRGGGPGSRGGKVPGDKSSSATTNAEGGTTRRGGGPGSRGGALTRKTRITKVEKQQLEKEKAEREKMALLTSKVSGADNVGLGGGLGLGLAQPPSLGDVSVAEGMIIDG